MYDLFCLLICAFGVYGLYVCLRKLFFDPDALDAPTCIGIRFRAEDREEDLEEKIRALRERAAREGTGSPVILLDFPVRKDVFRQLCRLDADVYFLCEGQDGENDDGDFR